MSSGTKNAPIVAGLIKSQKTNGRNIYDVQHGVSFYVYVAPGVSISKTALVNGMNTNALYFLN
jgi:hypothetical protein